MLPRSILPDIVALARDNGIRLCFVRVQRRPRPDGPPPQSEVLRRYVADLSGTSSRAARCSATTREIRTTRSTWYTDGDHTAGRLRQRYTELFAQKLADLFRVIFHSLDFVVFFLVTVAVYWALPHRWQNWWLLAASYVFYG